VYKQSTQYEDNQRRELVRPRHSQLQDQRDGKEHDDEVNVDLCQVSRAFQLVLLAGPVIVEMGTAAKHPAKKEAASLDDDQRRECVDGRVDDEPRSLAKHALVEEHAAQLDEGQGRRADEGDYEKDLARNGLLPARGCQLRRALDPGRRIAQRFRAHADKNGRCHAQHDDERKHNAPVVGAEASTLCMSRGQARAHNEDAHGREDGCRRPQLGGANVDVSHGHASISSDTKENVDNTKGVG